MWGFKIVSKVDSKAARHDSKEKVLLRLLDKPIALEVYAKLIEALFNFTQQSYEFAIARTNWKLGKTSINLFTLSFNWKNIAIPLYWVFLDNKGGNSSSDECISLIA